MGTILTVTEWDALEGRILLLGAGLFAEVKQTFEGWKARATCRRSPMAGNTM